MEAVYPDQYPVSLETGPILKDCEYTFRAIHDFFLVLEENKLYILYHA